MADTNGNWKNGNGMNSNKEAAGTCPTCDGMGMAGGCGCCCGRHHHGWRIILRIIVAIIVLGIVFSVGTMVGEFRAATGGYGRFPMMRSYYGNGGYYPMGGQGAAPATTSTPGR